MLDTGYSILDAGYSIVMPECFNPAFISRSGVCVPAEVNLKLIDINGESKKIIRWIIEKRAISSKTI